MKLIKDLKSIYAFKDNLNLGNIFFLTGIFFLPSALPIGALLLLFSIIISFNGNKEKLLKNKFNFSLFVCLLIILISTFYNTFLNHSDNFLDVQRSIVWINLFNWIPIYFAFLGFQVYLKSERQRLLFQKFLIAGTIPVLASCIMHKYLDIYGPFETLFGTIVWFNYESLLYAGKNPGLMGGGVSGLFNNPNYLGMWLTLCLPFALSLLRTERVNKNKLVLYVINILIIYFTLTTNSRNAFLGLIICFLLTFGIRKLIYFTTFIFLGLFLFNFFLPDFLNLDQSYLLDKFSNFSLNFNSPRLKIWGKALFLISERPLLGWGSGSMPYANMFFPPYQNYQHTHNMLIELAYNFGIPLSILIFSTIFKLVLDSYKKINNLSNSFTKNANYQSFIVAILIFLISHLNDITYYDGKISILFSVLLASLIKINEEKIILKKQLFK